MEKHTQQMDILHYLETHKRGITNAEAFEKFGVTRLGGQIYFLRKAGHPIVTDSIKVKTRYGSTTIARYRLEA